MEREDKNVYKDEDFTKYLAEQNTLGNDGSLSHLERQTPIADYYGCKTTEEASKAIEDARARRKKREEKGDDLTRSVTDPTNLSPNPFPVLLNRSISTPF